VSAIRDLFPFGDLDESVVASVARRFPIPPESVGAGLLLGKAIIGAIEHLTGVLTDAGLTPARWRLLIALVVQSGDAGATIGDLADHLGIREPTVTATVDRLEAEGLVSRIRSDADRRVVRVTLTEEGTATVATLAPKVATRITTFVDALGGPDEVRALTERVRAASGATD
jgi:DNA-binding MarR family transcriptional regulator